MFRFYFSVFFLFACSALQAQGYTNWIVGDAADFVSASYQFGVVLAGGGTDNDDAMAWMLSRAGGGDVVVIRASGSDGYNNYFYSELGVSVNSVETIRFDNASAALDDYVNQRLSEAELVFIAGGDQNVYANYWKDSPIADRLQQLIQQKGITVGGTSAGMAILGQAYYTPPGGAADSDELLGNPFHPDADILGYADFLDVPFLQGVVTDTHYDQRDRNGRHLVFMARLSAEHNQRFFGIACNEVTAVCIDENGQAIVFGEYPDYDDFAYFLQANCQSDFLPEIMEVGTPITWNRNGAALSVYKVAGTVSGQNTFDLTTWNTGSGGAWEHWYAENGQLERVVTNEAGCGLLASSINELDHLGIDIYPNPVKEELTIQLAHPEGVQSVQVYNQLGKLIYQDDSVRSLQQIEMVSWENGFYLLHIQTDLGTWTEKLIKLN